MGVDPEQFQQISYIPRGRSQLRGEPPLCLGDLAELFLCHVKTHKLIDDKLLRANRAGVVTFLHMPLFDRFFHIVSLNPFRMLFPRIKGRNPLRVEAVFRAVEQIDDRTDDTVNQCLQPGGVVFVQFCRLSDFQHRAVHHCFGVDLWNLKVRLITELLKISHISSSLPLQILTVPGMTMPYSITFSPLSHAALITVYSVPI